MAPDGSYARSAVLYSFLRRTGACHGLGCSYVTPSCRSRRPPLSPQLRVGDNGVGVGSKRARDFLVLAAKSVLAWLILRWLYTESLERNPPPPIGPIAVAFKRGYTYVYSVALADRITFGLRSHGLGLYSPALLLLISAWPCYVNAILLFAAPTLAVESATSWLLLVSLSALSAIMLLAAFTAWTYGYARSRDFDALITASPDRERFIHWFNTKLAHKRQAVAPIVAVLSSLLFLDFETPQLSTRFDIGVASYLCLGWTAFFGGNVMYWLYVMPAGVRLIYRSRELNVRWYDPASTPAFRGLAEGFGLSAIFLLAGVAVVTVLSFWTPHLFTIAPMRFLLSVLFITFSVLSFRVGIYVYIWLYAIIRRAKLKTLDIIERHVTEPAGDHGIEDIREWLSLYRDVSAAPHLPFSTAAVVQYFAALLGTVFAFAIQQLR
jgi:hypothetical protein